MAFNVRTLNAKKEGDLYVIQYQAYDDVDETVSPVGFQIQGYTRAELLAGLQAKVIRLKAVYEQRTTLMNLSDQAIEDLRTEGVI